LSSASCARPGARALSRRRGWPLARPCAQPQARSKRAAASLDRQAAVSIQQVGGARRARRPGRPPTGAEVARKAGWPGRPLAGADLHAEGVGVAGGQAIHAVVAEGDAQLADGVGLNLLAGALQLVVLPVRQVLQRAPCASERNCARCRGQCGPAPLLRRAPACVLLWIGPPPHREVPCACKDAGSGKTATALGAALRLPAVMQWVARPAVAYLTSAAVQARACRGTGSQTPQRAPQAGARAGGAPALRS